VGATDITLLGGFSVLVDDVALTPDRWSRRQAATLVKVLALAPGRRLHREQVIDALWPGVDITDAGPRLHKVAHYARRALSDDTAVVLRNEMVALLPEQTARVDVDTFLDLTREAEASGSSADLERALGAYAGPLLPEDPYEPWAAEPRDRVRQAYLGLLRASAHWEDLLREEPADEEAHLAIVRDLLEKGDVRRAERQFERLDHALMRELGTRASPEAEQLRARISSTRKVTGQPVTSRLVGRRAVADRVRAALDIAEQGRGSTLLVSGPPGVGKTSVLGLAEALAGQRNWRAGRGTASAVEGSWPYATVLEAFADLCRRHPALLDGLDDRYYAEIERALSGKDVRWSGDARHQRLFVAVAELMRLAASDHGLLLLIDDLHDADEASLRLLHYLSRCAMTEPVVIVVAHRPRIPETARQVEDSLVRKGAGSRIELGPLDLQGVRRLLREHAPELDEGRVAEISQASGGLPFAVLEMARGVQADGLTALPALPLATTETLQRLALLGTNFTTDQAVAMAHVAEDEAYGQLEEALEAHVVEPAEAGYRFRHPLVREHLVEALPPHRLVGMQRDVALRMAALGAPPARLAHLFVEAGLPSRAVPYVARAVETAGALGAYRDALLMIEAVRDHAGPDDLPLLLARRGDLLQALGDPEAVAAYQEAVLLTTGTEHRLVRARLARAAALAGELPLARDAVDGLTAQGDAADGEILLARGHIAFFSGDMEAAGLIADEGRHLESSPQDPASLLDLLTLQGLVAHQRGEWFERFHLELRHSRGRQRLATSLFDAHLCVAEYLLYGPVPYQEVIDDAEELLRLSERTGALRGVAFARALIGEAAMLMGDLPRAEVELTEAVELHHDTDAPAGEAHSLQRLAEVRLAQGDRAEARRLLQRALPLARWSIVAHHLLQRIYGTMISASPSPETARATVDQAQATLGDEDACIFCIVMLAVPAAIACAAVGDLEPARSFIAVAEASIQHWPGTAWTAAVLEAKAHLAMAEGRRSDADDLLREAAGGFEAAGQPVDAARCRGADPTLEAAVPTGS
jgi:DNA-binding SARP family transcriptional activator/DNA polymerase III delta prime subunit